MLGDIVYDPNATIDTGFITQGTINQVNQTPLTSQDLALNQLPLFSSMKNAISDVGGWAGLTTNVAPAGLAPTPFSWGTLGLVVVGLILFAEIAGRHGR